MLPKTYQNCCRATEAMASNRTILICSHKEACEAKYFVVEPNGGCSNFKPTQNPALADTNGARFIPLTQGRFAIVDPDDYDWLNQYKWYAAKCRTTFYAYRSKTRTTVNMHREIMCAPKGMICDHKNHNGLDNRKSNLRLCTNRQNQKARRGNLMSEKH